MKLRTKHHGTGEMLYMLSSLLQCTMCDCSWALMLAGMPPVHCKYLLSFALLWQNCGSVKSISDSSWGGFIWVGQPSLCVPSCRSARPFLLVWKIRNMQRPVADVQWLAVWNGPHKKKLCNGAANRCSLRGGRKAFQICSICIHEQSTVPRLDLMVLLNNVSSLALWGNQQSPFAF